MNIATVVSSRAHNLAFDSVAAVASVVGENWAQRLLAQSPVKVASGTFERAITQLQGERNELHARNRALQAENEAIKTARATLAKEHEVLKVMTAKRAAAVKALTTRTYVILGHRSTEALATLPVRAAPYLGIAALVGFTAVELRSDCELARSLAALSVEHGNEALDTGQICQAMDKLPTPDSVWQTVKGQASTSLHIAYSTLERVVAQLGFAL